MQVFYIKRNPQNQLDCINFIEQKTTNHYLVVTDQPKSSDFTLLSAHSNSFDIPLYKTVVLALVSYIPELDSKEWPQFYINLCRSDVIAVDLFNKTKLEKVPLPEKRFIITDSYCFSTNFKKQITENSNKFKLKNIDPNSNKLWDKFVEYVASTKKSKFIIANDENFDIGISFSPLGYNQIHCFSNTLPFIIVENGESSRYMDCRCNTYLNKRLGNIININGRGFASQIRDEMKMFVDTTQTLYEHILKNNDLLRFTSNYSLLDGLFHNLNSTYFS